MRESGRPPNFEKAAETLGVSVEDLRAALPARGDRQRGDGQRGDRQRGDRPRGERSQGDRPKRQQQKF